MTAVFIFESLRVMNANAAAKGIKIIPAITYSIFIFFLYGSPFAAMPDMPPQAAEPERPQAEEQRAPRSFMDGIPAYMRRK